MSDVRLSPLGKASEYPATYAPEVLFAVPRQDGRERIGIEQPLPFAGIDLWTAYELSWLNARGKPVVAVGEFRIPASSPNIVESKSLKLYLNSLHNRRFTRIEDVAQCIGDDLGAVAGEPVRISIRSLSEAAGAQANPWRGDCIDDLDISVHSYEFDPELLQPTDETADVIEETLYSHLLKSNCPVTGQPDWASVMIRYTGPRIDREGLLRYLVSFRNTAEFHEHCVERIFTDVHARCRTRRLSVYARYTRRGGLDINPFRSDFEQAPEAVRLVRQ